MPLVHQPADSAGADVSLNAIMRLGQRTVFVSYEVEFKGPDEVAVRIKQVRPFLADFRIGKPIRLAPRERAEASAELGGWELKNKDRERGKHDNRGKI